MSDHKIAAIVESQPRSGTHFLIDNLRRCYGWGYASIFPAEHTPEEWSHEEDGIHYLADSGGPPYVLKTHFFQRRRLDDVPLIALTSQLSRSYLKWARISKLTIHELTEVHAVKNVRWLVRINGVADVVIDYSDFFGRKVFVMDDLRSMIEPLLGKMPHPEKWIHADPSRR